MHSLTEIVPDVHRLTIPFEDIYTTVFIIKTPEGAVLLDTATYESDVDQYILPALRSLGISQDFLKYIVLSHSHRDHAGGLERLMEFFPDACIVSLSPEVRNRFALYASVSPDDHPFLLNALQLIPLPGHAPDCLALYDKRSCTLLTGDSLQLYGIYGNGNWGANISRPVEHLQAVKALRALEIDTVIASHDYHPCGYIARGSDEISRYLDCCGEALHRIHAFILKLPEMDDRSLAARYNLSSGLPTVGSHVFTAVRATAEEDLF